MSQEVNYLIILALITSALCQHFQNAVKPDVTFGDHNARFDVKRILRHQKKSYNNYALDPQSEEYRRSIRNKHKKLTNPNKDHRSEMFLEGQTRKGRKHTGSKLRKKIVRELEDHVNNLANSIIQKMRSFRRNEDFAHHDDMNSDGGKIEDYKANLKKFEENFRKDDIPTRRLQDIVDKLHGMKQSRRSMSDPEKEILLHYAFPLQMKIEGFLQMPLVDQ